MSAHKTSYGVILLCLLLNNYMTELHKYLLLTTVVVCFFFFSEIGPDHREDSELQSQINYIPHLSKYSSLCSKM